MPVAKIALLYWIIALKKVIILFLTRQKNYKHWFIETFCVSIEK